VRAARRALFVVAAEARKRHALPIVFPLGPEDRLNKLAATLLCAAATVVPIASRAAAVDPALIPDGTYVVKVERVEDARHLLVMMRNGVETTLIARSTIDFSKVKANDTLKISLIKGIVPVYIVQ
jgi:hypothetical protein